MTSEKKKELQLFAVRARKNILSSIHAAGSGHPGGSLSAIDYLTYLYNEVMHIDPKNPSWDMRDRFVLSKGHVAPALYSVLAQKGYFPEKDLLMLRQPDSHLQGHPNMNDTPGIDFSTGSLGQGISGAAGMAKAARYIGSGIRVFTLLGDGEIAEGIVWEAVSWAVHYKLDNGSKAVNAVDDYLAQYGDELKAVICDNDDMSSAAQAECNAKGREDIVCIGVDGNQGPLTLSEQYCNETALYLSMILKTEDAFPDTMLDQNGQPVIDLLGSSMRFNYNPDPIHPDAYLDGAMVDDHTYAGVLRVNLDETLRRPVIADNVSEGEKPETDGQITYETITLPEQFSVQFKIPRVDGTLPESCMPEIPEDIRKEYEDAMAEAGLGTTDDAYASFSEEEQEIEGELSNRMWNQYVQRYPDADEYPNQYENWWVDGPWEFDFDVTVDHSETISVKANREGNCDIGEIEVTKTPFELALYYDYNKAAEHDYFVAVLDADGELMGFGHQGGSTDEHPITGHDVSEVTVYVCDYMEYMDELKGYYYSSDYEEKAKEKTFKQLLDERCVYSEKVSF